MARNLTRAPVSAAPPLCDPPVLRSLSPDAPPVARGQAVRVRASGPESLQELRRVRQPSFDLGSRHFAMQATSRSSWLLPLGLASSALAPASAQTQVPAVTLRDARLLSSDLESLDGLGASVAMSNNTVVVGAPTASPNGVDQAGAAYVFVRAPFGWIEQAKLVASDGAPLDIFGVSVAIDGDRIAVGALRANVGGVPAVGAVYVFERAGSTWLETDKLVGAGADVGEGVGWSLALQGDLLVAGAVDDHHSGGQFNGGAAYVFVRGASGWSQEQ